MLSSSETLGDWGEFRILNEIVLPKLRRVSPSKALGDDCAFIPAKFEVNDEIVVTTDVGPKPLAWEIGLDSYWSWGWYSVVVNLSDLASAGARPLAFASSIDAPSEMLVRDLEQFFDGIADACCEFRVKSGGGNIRTAAKFACHGMALGRVNSECRIGRDGCHAGDYVVAIGECGKLMSAYLRAKSVNAGVSEQDKLRLLRPIPRVREMQILGDARLISAATDNSDGILGSLWNIAERSMCGFQLDVPNDSIPSDVLQAASEFSLDIMNLMFCWGDWQIVAAVKEEHFERFNHIAAVNEIPFTLLGRAIEGPPAIYGSWSGRNRKLRVIRNENFTPTSFNVGLDAHVDYMLRSSLFE